METLLVFGGSGLLGGKVAALARESFQGVATYTRTKPGHPGINFVELPKENVEERDLAWQVNAGSTGSLARVATDIGARYLFVSTDFVFDGTKGGYREQDVPRPLNRFGQTKLAGEHAVLAATADHLVARPGLLYGWDDTDLNFATWVLSSARDGTPIDVATDWIASPTFADSLAAGILQLLKVPVGGVFHLAGADGMSQYDFAVRLVDAFGLDPKMVQPVRSAEFHLKAPRPANAFLSSAKAKRHRIAVLPAEEGIAAMKEQRSLDSFVLPERFESGVSR